MILPGHELDAAQPLRDVAGQRRVWRTRLAGRACVTRVLLAERLPRTLAPLVAPVVLDGRGSLPGVPEPLALTLEGYRVAARLTPTDPPRWPRALAAGVTDDGYVYVTTAWIDGTPLSEALRPLGAPSEVALDLLRALAALHRQHVVFGDLKPSNVVLTPTGGAALIDLDTLREVGGLHVPTPTRDLTPDWAAPEQLRERHTYLASDLWAYARLLPDLFPAGLPEAWRGAVGACRAAEPLRRPRTDLLLQVLEGADVELRDWLDRPVVAGLDGPGPAPAGGATATERVEETSDAGPPRGGARTERVQETTGTWTPTPSPTSPAAPRSRLTFMGCLTWSAGLAGLLVGACSGLFWWWDSRAIAEADGLADDAMAAMKAYKTRPALNADKSQRAALMDMGDRAWEAHHTPRATAVRALAHVWAHGWQDAGAKWDAQAFAEQEEAVGDAATSPEPAALLAWGTLQGARCRLDHESAAAAVACTRALTALEAFPEALPDEEDTRWLRVEALWTEVLVRGEVARSALASGLPDGARQLELTLTRCEAAEPLLPYAPVNGPELVQDCLRYAAAAADLPRYFHLARWLVDRDRADGSLGRTTVWHVYAAAGSGCDAVSVAQKRGDWVIKGDPWCLAVGHAARGCLDASRDVIRQVDPTSADHPWDRLVSTVATLSGDCAR